LRAAGFPLMGGGVAGLGEVWGGRGARVIWGGKGDTSQTGGDALAAVFRRRRKFGKPIHANTKRKQRGRRGLGFRHIQSVPRACGSFKSKENKND